MLRAALANPAAAFGAVVLSAVLLAGVLAPWLAPQEPGRIVRGEQLQPPGAGHPFGTDSLGRDVLAGVVYGARVTVQIGLIAVGIALVVGVPLGGVAGYFGGWADALIMRSMDVLLALPGILLALTIVSLLGRGVFEVMIAVGLAEVPKFARQVRASVVALREREFVLASRALGAGPWSILFRRILPNALGPIIVLATLGMGSAVLDAAGLGFLGLGAKPQTPEWGTMLADNRDYLRDHPWVSLFPGLAIAVTVLGFNLLGEGLGRHLDPRRKSSVR